MSDAAKHALALAADHYSSAVTQLQLAGYQTPPSTLATNLAENRAMALTRAGVHAQLAMFCAKAAELGVDLRTQQERDQDRERLERAAGLYCPHCDHRHSSHTVYPGGVGPHPEITGTTYTACSACAGANPQGPCA